MRRTLAPLLGTLALAAPNAAQAKVVNAEANLPPGQSGYVSITGVASGTGSPHLTDQVDNFVNLRWRPFTFNEPGATEEPRPGVKITRNSYGIPSVTAGSHTDAWWGVGYAVAQDRIFQIELFRRATTGRLAEILGTGFVDDDRIARRDYYTAAELQSMWDAAPAELRARGDAYREGVNAWIEHLNSNPTQIPGEFIALGVPLKPLTTVEQAAIGVFLARTVPSGDGNELNNLKLLRGAGRKALDALVPISQPRETYTVPPSEGRFTSDHNRGRRAAAKAFARSLKASAAWDVKPDPPAGAGRRSDPDFFRSPIGGSFMFAARDPKTKHTYLFNGPQLGYSIPELFVEFELHYPGLDLRGVSAAGVPVVGIGHNGNVAWGFTSGLTDEDDLYAESLVGDEKSETYRHKGQELKMDCRDEVIVYRTPATDIAGGAPNENGSVTERVCRTVHGPVQERAGDTAYARRYAIWGREIESLTGLSMLNAAKTIQDVDEAMLNVTWNENVLAIDSKGQLGYWHPGLHQVRPKGFDERLPYPGTGEAEWRGLRPRRRTPYVVNPKQGWLANWNNLPAAGWTTGDGESQERLSAQFHRGQFLQRAVRAWARKPTFAGAQDVLRHVGTTAQQRPLAAVRIRRALSGSEGTAREVLAALSAWDGSYHRTDANGTVDPGVAIWEELKDQLEEIALRRLGPNVAAMRTMASGTGSSHAFDISNGEAYAVRKLRWTDWRKAAEATHAKLAARFNSPDVSKWREPRRMYGWQLQGAASPPPIPFFDRGTWEQFVELAP